MATGFDGGGFYSIGGGLPFGNSSGAGAIGARNPGQVSAAYQGAYNNALAMNQSNYNNVLRGYQQAIATQTSAQSAIQAGYSNLYNDVLSRVQGIGAARSQAIDSASAKTLASGSQSLINRGLGNSTIQSSWDRGVESDRQYQQTQLSDALAKQVGDYMSNLGLAGLNNQQRGLEGLSSFAGRQLDFMNSVQAKYPDAGMYASLAQQAGQGDGRATNPPPGMYGGGSFSGAGGNPGPKVGYVPSAPYYGGGGADPSNYGGGGGGGSWLMDQYSAGSAAGAGANASGWGGSYGAGNYAGGSGSVSAGADYGGGGADSWADYGGGGGSWF